MKPILDTLSKPERDTFVRERLEDGIKHPENFSDAFKVVDSRTADAAIENHVAHRIDAGAKYRRLQRPSKSYLRW